MHVLNANYAPLDTVLIELTKEELQELCELCYVCYVAVSRIGGAVDMFYSLHKHTQWNGERNTMKYYASNFANIQFDNTLRLKQK
jgi:hypothetical protein